MRVLVTGSRGLIGRAISEALRQRGDEVIPLVRRRASDGEVAWDPVAGTIDVAALAAVNADAVVHLAGESVQGRWTSRKRAAIRDSRINGTRLLVDGLSELGSDHRPRVLITASAIGIYGDRPGERLVESARPGEGFLAEVGVGWEREGRRALDLEVRAAQLRIGIVQSADGGALKAALTPFRMGVGGPFGSGRQIFSWVSIDDVVGAFLHCLENDSVSGPVNVTSPGAVTNRQWAATIAKVLRRPCLFPVPRPAARVALGEFANELYKDTNVIPSVLAETGYRFRDTELEPTLRRLLSA